MLIDSGSGVARNAVLIGSGGGRDGAGPMRVSTERSGGGGGRSATGGASFGAADGSRAGGDWITGRVGSSSSGGIVPLPMRGVTLCA